MIRFLIEASLSVTSVIQIFLFFLNPFMLHISVFGECELMSQVGLVGWKLLAESQDELETLKNDIRFCLHCFKSISLVELAVVGWFY